MEREYFRSSEIRQIVIVGLQSMVRPVRSKIVRESRLMGPAHLRTGPLRSHSACKPAPGPNESVENLESQNLRSPLGFLCGAPLCKVIYDCFQNLSYNIRYGLVARICRSHRRVCSQQRRQGPGSIPGVGKTFFCQYSTIEGWW